MTALERTEETSRAHPAALTLAGEFDNCGGVPLPRSRGSGDRLVARGGNRGCNAQVKSEPREGWNPNHGPSMSHCDGTPNIENQEEHHRIQTFDDEYKAFLDRHGIEYDGRFVFG